MAVPTLSSISPTSCVQGASTVRITCTGSGMFGGPGGPLVPDQEPEPGPGPARLTFDGVEYATTIVSSTSCYADVPGSALTTARSASVQLENNEGSSVAKTFTITEAVPAITSITPSSAAAGSSFTLDVFGSGFNSACVIQISGSNRTTTFINAGQVRTTGVTFPVGETKTVTVNKPTVGTSNGVSLSITNPVPTVTSISPTSKTAGDAQFTLTVNGSNFVPGGTQVYWNGTGNPKATTYVSSTQLTAVIPASDLATGGTASVIVTNLAPGGGTVSTSFTVNNPAPNLTSINPTTALVGSSATTVTVNGNGFVPGSVVKWNGVSQATSYVSATALTFTATASMLSSTGSNTVTVFNPAPGGGTSTGATLSVNNPTPVANNLIPNDSVRGVLQTVDVLSTNNTFVSGSQVLVNGNARTTTFVNAGNLRFTLTSSDAATARVLSVSVSSPTPGGGTSNTRSYTVENPEPTLSSLSTTSRTVGNAAFDVTLTGTNFASDTVVRVNGSNRVTTYISATGVKGTITAADQASAGTLAVTAYNPTPGGGTSTAQNITVNNPVPTITSINPVTAVKGGAQFILTVNGTGFINAASVVRWNGTDRATVFVSSTQLTATIPATDLTSAGTATVTVFTSGPGGGTSAGHTFTINNPVPAITSLSPGNVLAGAATFTLTVNGSNFVNGSTIYWDGVAKATTFVSATQLTASIPASEVDTAGSAAVTVVTGTPGGGTSNVATFYIGAVNPAPSITSISPTNRDEGSAAFTLTVNGSNFVSGAVVQWGGSNRTTTFVSASQLTASIPASDVSVPGSKVVTVVNPAPGGGSSGNASFIVNDTNPVPTLSTISPASATAGAAQFTLTVDGSNFISGVSTVRWNGSSRTTTFVSSTRLTAIITATDVASQGSASVTVFNAAPGGGTSAPAPFTIQAVANNPTPAVTSLSPNSVTAGASAFTLTVTGTGFYSGSVVRWNGVAKTTTFVSSTSLTASITASDVISAGSFPVTVFNTTPGGGTSNAVNFAVLAPTNPKPTITSLSPPSVPKGNAPFTLSVFGTGFVPSTSVQLDGTNRTTSYQSATRIDAAVSSDDVAQAPGSVSVINPRANPSFASVNAENVRAVAAGSAFAPAITIGDSGETRTGLFASAPALLDIAAGGVHVAEASQDAFTVFTDLVSTEVAGPHTANTIEFAKAGQLAKAYIQASSIVGGTDGQMNLSLFVNSRKKEGANEWDRDNVNLPTWGIEFGSEQDGFVIERAPAGANPAIYDSFMEIDNEGNTAFKGNLILPMADKVGGEGYLRVADKHFLFSDGTASLNATGEDSTIAVGGAPLIGARLEVIGPGPGYSLQLIDTTPTTAGVGPAVTLWGKYNAAGAYTSFGQLMAYKENATDGNTAGALWLSTRPDGGVLTPRLRIDSDGTVNALGAMTVNGSTLGAGAAFQVNATTNAIARLVATATDSNATLQLVNDARTWQVYVKGNGADALVFRDATAATDRVFIDTSGNVGIGAAPASGLMLHVTGGSGIRHETTTTDSIARFSLKNDAREWQITNNGASADAFTVRDSTASADRLVIDASGNLSVGAAPGTAAASIAQRLEVYGPSNAVTDTVAALWDTATAAQDVGGGIALGGKYSATGSYGTFALIKSHKENATDNNYASALTLWTRAHGAGLVERMRVASTGNVTFSGTLTERGRSVPVGEWTDVAFAAGNFTAGGGSSPLWTLVSADQVTYAYRIVGKAMLVAFDFETTTISGSPTVLNVPVPASAIAAKNVYSTYQHYNGSTWEAGQVRVTAGGTSIQFYRAIAGSAFAAATDTAHFRGQIEFPIQ